MSSLEALSQLYLMHLPIRATTHSPSTTTNVNVGKLFAISGHCLSCYTYICIHLLLTYTQNVHGVTLHMSQYSKAIPRQLAISCYMLQRLQSKHCQTVIGTQDQCISSHTVHVHTLYLLWGLDVNTFKLLDLIEPDQQLCQHIRWKPLQSNMLHTSLSICRHWV